MYTGQPRLVIAGWSFVTRPYFIEQGRVDTSLYTISINPVTLQLHLQRCQWPMGCIWLGARYPGITSGEWQDVEIGTYQNQLRVWIVGILYFKYNDPIPLPNGTFILEASVLLLDDQSVVYFDDISVCELTAPFGTVPTPES